MELNCTIVTLFLFQSFMWSNNIMSFALNYAYSKDNNIDCATRPPRILSHIIHAITDKAAYLSEATK